MAELMPKKSVLLYAPETCLFLQTYRDSLQKLQLMTDGELEQIFGPVDKIIPLHEGRQIPLYVQLTVW